jgi:hypothetical protein
MRHLDARLENIILLDYYAYIHISLLMHAFCDKFHLGRGERVVGWQSNIYSKLSSFEWCSVWTFDNLSDTDEICEYDLGGSVVCM